MILLIKKERRQRDRHIELPWPIRIAVFLAQNLLLRVGQAFVSFIQQDERGLRRGIIWVQIGMKFDGLFAVGLLYLLFG